MSDDESDYDFYMRWKRGRDQHRAIKRDGRREITKDVFRVIGIILLVLTVISAVSSPIVVSIHYTCTQGKIERQLKDMRDERDNLQSFSLECNFNTSGEFVGVLSEIHYRANIYTYNFYFHPLGTVYNSWFSLQYRGFYYDIQLMAEHAGLKSLTIYGVNYETTEIYLYVVFEGQLSAYRWGLNYTVTTNNFDLTYVENQIPMNYYDFTPIDFHNTNLKYFDEIIIAFEFYDSQSQRFDILHEIRGDIPFFCMGVFTFAMIFYYGWKKL